MLGKQHYRTSLKLGPTVNFAYAEFHFADVHWPDFNAAGLRQALDEFHNRQRRFGAVAPTRLQALR